jgi:hypothetical protein
LILPSITQSTVGVGYQGTVPPGTSKPQETDEERENWHHLLRADSYGAVLVLLLALFMVPAITPDTQFWRVVIIVVAILSVLTSLHTSRVPRWLFGAACVGSAIALVGVLWQPQVTNIEAVGYLLIGLLLLAAPVAILNRIVRHHHVTVRTLLGAIDVYLQLGIAFSFVYRTIEHFDPGSYSGAGPMDGTALAYFSFVTLATLGYGDIVPTTQLARNLAVLETVIGQVFLVVVVARVVTTLGHQREFTPARDRRRMGKERGE